MGRNGGGGGVANDERMARAAAAALRRTVSAAGEDAYDRNRVLPRLIGLDPAELERAGPRLDETIRTRLARALRRERRSGLTGSWTYDLNRHVALLQAMAAESRRKTSRPARPGGSRCD